jgi:hypothetical protein
MLGKRQSEAEEEQEMTENTGAKVHGNTRKAADLSLAKREISPDSHRAVHEGRISLEEARELGRNAGPSGPAVRVSKDDRTPTKTPCLWGCGILVARIFAPGHDMRMVSLAKIYVRGEANPNEAQMAYLEESGKLERAKAQVARENERARERATKKAEREAAKAKKAAKKAGGGE